MTPAELHIWRLAQHLSQSRLAALLHVDVMTISRWERGDRAIPPFLYLALETLEALPLEPLPLEPLPPR